MMEESDLFKAHMMQQYLYETQSILNNAIDIFQDPFPPATQKQCIEVLKEITIASKKLDFLHKYFVEFVKKFDASKSICEEVSNLNLIENGSQRVLEDFD